MPRTRRRTRFTSRHGAAIAGMILVGVIVLVSCGPPSALRADEQADTPLIVRAINASLAQIDSLHVKTRVRNEVFGQPGEKLAISYGFGMTSLDEFAFKRGNKKYRCRKAWRGGLPKNSKLTGWSEDRLAFDGELLRAHLVTCEPPKGPRTVEGSLSATAGNSRIGQCNIYNEAVGCLFLDQENLEVWRLWHQYPKEGDVNQYKASNPFPLLPALESGRYQRRPQLESVGELKCLVLEKPGWDTIWLAPDLGYAIVKRELLWPGTKSVMLRMGNEQLQQVVNGFWLPRLVTYELLGAPSHGREYEGHVLIRSIVNVTDFVVNSVPDTLFTYDFPSGTMVVDFTRKGDLGGESAAVVYPVGSDPETTQISLDNAIAIQREFADGARWRWRLIWGNVALALIVAATVFVYRWHTRRRASAPKPVAT
jgi:hypothetical protein